MRFFTSMTSALALGASLVSATPLLATRNDKNEKDDKGCCLSQNDAQNIVNAFASLIGGYSDDKAIALLAKDVKDYSDSINTLAGLPLGGVTFDGLDNFMTNQRACNCNLPLVPLSIDAVTCNVIAFTWDATFGKANLPVKGINLLTVESINGVWKIKTIKTEFNSLIYDKDAGGDFTLPPAP